MGCVEWLRGVDRKGYGRISDSGRMRFVHRVSWERARGPIPDGLCVLHRCDNPRCFNVAHLFLGTNADNSLDMSRKWRDKNQNTRKTHCAKGHLLQPRWNTNKRTKRGAPHRYCRTCALKADRIYSKKRYYEQKRLKRIRGEK